MKKIALALSIATLFVACKKEKENTVEVTDTTGSMVLSGTVSKSIITHNANGSWTTGQTLAAGVPVTVRVAKSQLYPGSNALGFNVYTATTDNAGRYSLNIKTPGSGSAQAFLTIESWNGTLDTLINGTIKTGLPGVYIGFTSNYNVSTGSNLTQNHNAGFSPSSSNPNPTMLGAAQASGQVFTQWIRTSAPNATTSPAVSTTNIPVGSGVTVYLSLDKDPVTLMKKMYMTQTDAAGRYSFTGLSTVAAGTSGFGQNAEIWVADLARTQDTLKLVGTTVVATSTVTGRAGVYNNTLINANGLFNNENRNGQNINMTSFTQN